MASNRRPPASVVWLYEGLKVWVYESNQSLMHACMFRSFSFQACKPEVVRGHVLRIMTDVLRTGIAEIANGERRPLRNALRRRAAARDA
eukprot:11187634-Lingulodinium_polyedra.AAC.2